MDPPRERSAQEYAVVVVPPTAGLGPPLWSQLPLGLLAVAVRVDGLTTGLRVQTIRAAGQVGATTLDLTREQTFQEVLEHLAGGAHDGDDPHWLHVSCRVGAAASAQPTAAPLQLDVAAGTTGLRCTVRCDPATLRPSRAERLGDCMLTAHARVAGDLTRSLTALVAETGDAATSVPAPTAGTSLGSAGSQLRRPTDLPTPLTPPRTPLERQLVDLWRQVLAIDELGVDDDFFEVGGHSLLAAVLVSQMRNALGAEIPVESLYLQPTVTAVAAEIEASRAGRSLAEA